MKKSNKQKNAAVARKRERRDRRSAARVVQNHRTPVIKAQVDEFDPLSRLTDEFRNNIKWTAPAHEAPVPQDADNHMVMMIRRPPEKNERIDNRFVAVNQKTYNAAPLDGQQDLQELLWQDVLENIRLTPIDFVKSGGDIWDRINLHPVKDLVESAVSMHDVDADTFRAINAALFTAYNTSAAPADLETVTAALAAFIHAHPHFKNMVDEGEFHQPFGADTFWTLLKPFEY